MLPVLLRRAAVPVLLAGLLSGCQGKTVVVTDEAAFAAMARRTAPLLRSRDILDSDGAYLTTLFSAFDNVPQDAGERLFQRLSPAFRFRHTDPAMLPATFAQVKAPGDTLRLAPQGFVLTQGGQRIEVSLLGLADWNGGDRRSWFVQCRILRPDSHEERTYYLVIEDPEAAIYQPMVLAVYDCRQGRCATYLEQTPEALPEEDAVVDLLPGQQDITAPPRE